LCAKPTTTTLDSHFWRVQPWVGHAVGAAWPSCWLAITPEGIRGVPRRSSSERCRPATSLMADRAGALCRTPPPCPASRARLRGPGSACPAFHQETRLGRSKTPSTNRSHRPRPDSRQSEGCMGRHRYPGLAAKGPASDMRSRPFLGALDPRADRLFAGALGPHAACQLLQRSVPRARQRAVPSPSWIVASHVPLEDDIPCEIPPAGLSQARGRLACSSVDPHHDDRSPQWIYPDLTDPDTSCREFVSDHTWKPSVARRPCGRGLSRTYPPGARRLRFAHLVGPSPVPSRERKSTGDRTRGAFRRESSP